MAVEQQPASARVYLTYYEGDDLEGEPIESRTSYALRTSADPQVVYDLMNELASLCKHELVEVQLSESSVLIEVPEG